VRALRSRRSLPKLDLAGSIAWPNSLGKAGLNNNYGSHQCQQGLSSAYALPGRRLPAGLM